MKIPYSICINMKMAMEYELANHLLMQKERDEKLIGYFSKRIKELEEHAANQQG